jgi:two-component system cell cycle sensor histidine kinase/response regulator CckA
MGETVLGREPANTASCPTYARSRLVFLPSVSHHRRTDSKSYLFVGVTVPLEVTMVVPVVSPRASSKSADFHATVASVLEACLSISPIDTVGVALRSPERDSYRFEVVRGTLTRLQGVTFRRGQGLPGIVADVGQTISCLSVTPDFLGLIQSDPRDTSVRSALLVPLLADDGVVGVLAALSQEDDNFTRVNQRFLEAMAKHVAAIYVAHQRASGTYSELEALLRGERKYRSVVEKNRDLVVVIDPEGTILYESPSLATTLGPLPGKNMSRNAFEMIHPEDAGNVKQAIERMVREDLPSATSVFRMKALDDTWRSLEGSLSNQISDPDVRAIVLNLRAAPERAAMAPDGFELAAAAVQNAGDLIIILDRMGRILQFNRAAELATAYSFGEVEKAVFWEHFVRLVDLGEVMTDFQNANPSAFPSAHEKYWLTKHGEPRLIAWSTGAIADEHGAITHFVLTGSDVTARRRAEESLRESEQRLRSMTDHVPDAIYQYRLLPTAGFTYVNTAMTRLTGYTAEEFYANPALIDKITHPDDVPALTALRTTLAAGNATTIDWNSPVIVRWRTKGGEVIATEQHFVPIRDAAGRVIGFEGIGQNVTDRTKLTEQMVEQKQMEAVGRLAGGVSHDFNNLLTVITGFSELLLKSLRPGDVHHQYVQEIAGAAQRAAFITRQLLAFSRQQFMSPVELDINQILGDTEKMLRPLFGADIKLIVNLDPSLDKVKADANQIEQVVINLAVNAGDAMPLGGRLTIETANVTVIQALACSHGRVEPGRYVTIALTDTGSGMDSVTKARIFEPFFTTHVVGKGSGLGLSTVLGIVQQSGGQVCVDSEVGRGTTFTIYLPAITSTAEVATVPVPTPPRRSDTILLVEDENVLRSLVRLVLEGQGYQVLEATSMIEALDVAADYGGPIELLLSDVVMPGGSGPELAEKLAATRQAMKVLFMSGYTDDVVLRSGVLADSSSFLQKPFTSAGLGIKIREVLANFPLN